MQLADLAIDQPQQALQRLVRTYDSAFSYDGTFVAAETQLERDCFSMTEEGWRLKKVSHRGSIVSPSMVVIATYER